MNFNKLLLDKIDNFVKLSKEFDEDYKQVIWISDNKLLDIHIKCIYTLTKNYILLRTAHGKFILMMDQYKDSINTKLLETDDNNINELYDLSTFSSIMININGLIDNIDFQYKKIAIKYPKFINKKPLTVLLLTNTDDKENEYIKLIEKIKQQSPENIYSIIKCDKKEKKFKCDKILGVNLTIKLTSLPMLYVINGINIVEIPIDKINNIEALTNIIK